MWPHPAKDAIKNTQKLLNGYSIGLHHPKNLVKNVLSEGHSAKYAIEVNRRLQEAANKAIADGLKKKGIRNAILGELDKIANQIKRSPKDLFK